jgi:hypothetical protein
MRKAEILRKKYPKFGFESYSWKISKGNLKISFDFKIEPNIFFKPRIIIKNVKESQIKKLGEEILDNLVFNLGLIELLSYWKATCSPEILIKAGYLNKEQIEWWKNLIDRGMGQFFFENKIDFKKPNFLQITCQDGRDLITNSHDRTNYETLRGRVNRRLMSTGVLVPVGGGKDSIVTLEILKQVKFAWGHSHTPSRRRGLPYSYACFSLNPTEAAKKIMRVAGCHIPIIVERKIDKKLLELNRKGFLNGHTPFSAYLAFLSILVAVLFDFKYIAFSNERSSNKGNVKYLERVINHQYSKSFDFEKKFRKYCQNYLTPEVQYFSFLRPLYEIQIAKIFSRYPQYFNAFLSCNEAFKTYSGTKKPPGKWCGKCSKCLFVYAILYPFIDEKKLEGIFGQNLFEKKSLLPLMLELIGERRFKPFECVGTKKESFIAFYLSYKKYRGSTPANIPALLKYFERNILPKHQNLEKESKKILNSWNKNHFLPKNFEKILKMAI